MAVIKAEAISFNIDIKGDITGQDFKGYFEALPRLSHRLQLEKDKIRRQLLGESQAGASESALQLAAILSDLRVRLTSWPKWWEEYGLGMDMEDNNVLLELAEKIVDIMQKEEQRIQKRAEEAQNELKKNVAK